MHVLFKVVAVLIISVNFFPPFDAIADEKKCVDELVESKEYVSSETLLKCVKESMEVNLQAAKEIAKTEAIHSIQEHKSEFLKIARENIIFLGNISSCSEHEIDVPIEGTTTKDWHIVTANESYTAAMGRGESRNNALYATSFKATPVKNNKAWSMYLNVSINSATEQKRERTVHCETQGNDKSSRADIYAIRRY